MDKKRGERHVAGTLAMQWAFTLGTGNYIKLAIAAGEDVQAATVTYTVDYLPPPAQT